MKRAIFVLALVSAFFNSYSQYSISGKISNDKGEPLQGANVIIDGSFQGTYTNQQGEFDLGYLKSGDYKLIFSFLGYESHHETITLNENINLEVVLQKSEHMADEVIISGIYAGDKTPVAQTILSKDDLEKKNLGQDVPYLLALTPSLVTSSDGGTGIGYTSLRLRGTDINRINITINGIPLNDPMSHGVYWVDLPDFASSVENIQIQRGVGTSSNGAAAFGGSINLQTDALHEDAYAEIEGGYGSFNTQKASVKAGTGLLKDKFTLDTRFSKIYSDGFVDRAFSDLSSFFISGGYYDEKNIIKLNVFQGVEETYQAWGGVPKAALDTNRTYNPYNYENEIDHYEQTHFQLFYSRQLNPALFLNTAFHCTLGEGYYEQYEDDDDYYDQTSFSFYGLENVTIGDTTITNTDLIRRLWMDNIFYGITYSLKYEAGRLNLTLGGGWNQYDGDYFGRVIWARYASNSEIRHEFYRNNGTKKDYNMYAKANYSLSDMINIFGDVQYRKIDFTTRGDDNGLTGLDIHEAFNFINPKAGITADISNSQQAYFSFSIANREPNRDNFTDAMAMGLEAPVKETLYDFELGYAIRGNNYKVNTNLYYMNYKNQLVMTGELNHVGMPLLRNVKDSYRRGIEVEAGYKPIKNLRWDVNATLSQNKIRNFNSKVELYDDQTNWAWIDYATETLKETDLSFSPSIIAASQLSYEVIKNLDVSLITKYVGKQYIDNTSNDDRSIDPYFVNNVQISYSLFDVLGREVFFNLMVNNILDEEYETNAWVYRATFADGSEYTDFGYYPQAGTNFLGGITVKF
ncbi:MAG: TonB-dependent receptor [Bacteroidales bacterium]|nr:TonB-dependent receptor [Bacteroidales bacterium]